MGHWSDTQNQESIYDVKTLKNFHSNEIRSNNTVEANRGDCCMGACVCLLRDFRLSGPCSSGMLRGRGLWSPTFRDSVSVAYSRVTQPKNGLLRPWRWDRYNVPKVIKIFTPPPRIIGDDWRPVCLWLTSTDRGVTTCWALLWLRKAVGRKIPGLLRRGVTSLHYSSMPGASYWTFNWPQEYGWSMWTIVLSTVPISHLLISIDIDPRIL
jgi:hypothetical protein